MCSINWPGLLLTIALLLIWWFSTLIRLNDLWGFHRNNCFADMMGHVLIFCADPGDNIRWLMDDVGTNFTVGFFVAPILAVVIRKLIWNCRYAWKYTYETQTCPISLHEWTIPFAMLSHVKKKYKTFATKYARICLLIMAKDIMGSLLTITEKSPWTANTGVSPEMNDDYF